MTPEQIREAVAEAHRYGWPKLPWGFGVIWAHIKKAALAHADFLEYRHSDELRENLLRLLIDGYEGKWKYGEWVDQIIALLDRRN